GVDQGGGRIRPRLDRVRHAERLVGAEAQPLAQQQDLGAALVAGPGLDEDHAELGIIGQPAGQDGAAGAAAHHDDVCVHGRCTIRLRLCSTTFASWPLTSSAAASSIGASWGCWATASGTRPLPTWWDSDRAPRP